MRTKKKSVTERSRTAMADKLNPCFPAISFSRWGTLSADLLIGRDLRIGGDADGFAVREEVGAERHHGLAGLEPSAKEDFLGPHLLDLHWAEAHRRSAWR